MTLKFELGRDFCTMHLPTKFHHPQFNHSEVILFTNTHKQTHKQTVIGENIHLTQLAKPMENNEFLTIFLKSAGPATACMLLLGAFCVSRKVEDVQRMGYHHQILSIR